MNLPKNHQKIQTPLESTGKSRHDIIYQVFLDEFEQSSIATQKDEDVIFEHEPVDIITFVESPDYLDLSSSTKPWIKEVLEEMMQGWEIMQPKYREAVISSSIGVGKSFMAGIVSAYTAHLLICLKNPQAFFGHAKGTKYAIINNSVNAKQAKKGVFGETYSKIIYSKWFRQYAPWNDAITSELQFDILPERMDQMEDNKIYKNVYIMPGSSNPHSAVGYNLFMGIIDEASLYGESSEGECIGTLIYDTMRVRIKSRFGKRGFLLVCGSPQYTQDFLENRYNESKEEDNVFRKRITAWEASYPNYQGETFHFNHKDLKIVDAPTIDTLEIPVDYKEDFQKSPVISLRDLAAMPVDSVSPFFTNFDIVKKMIDHDRIDPLSNSNQGNHTPEDLLKDEKGEVILKPYPCLYNAIHIDTAYKFDAAALCMSTLVDLDSDGSPLIRMDLLVRLVGSNTNPIELQNIRKWIYYLREIGFRIDRVSLDGWQSLDTMQILESKGYLTKKISTDITPKPYNDLKEAINGNRVNTYINSKVPFSSTNILMREMKRLEDIKGRKIDHPRKGSKDCSDALAGSVHSILLACMDGDISEFPEMLPEDSFCFENSIII